MYTRCHVSRGERNLENATRLATTRCPGPKRVCRETIMQANIIHACICERTRGTRDIAES